MGTSLHTRTRWGGCQCGALNNKSNLTLNTTKMKEMVLDFIGRKMGIQPLFIGGECRERLTSFQFLGMHIEDNLIWTTNSRATIKKQRLSNHLCQTACVLLLMIHWEYPDALRLCVVFQLHSWRQDGAPKGCHRSPGNHWLPPSLHGGTLQFSLFQEGMAHTQGSNPSWKLLNPYPLAVISAQ